MTRPRSEKARAELERERTRLASLIEDLVSGGAQGDWTGTSHEPGDVVDDAASRAARTENDSVLEVARRRLGQIDDALERLDEGTYGICEVCGRRIAAARLDALPFTTVCVEHVSGARRSA